MGGKLKYFIVSILIAAILAGIGVGIYMSWPAITGTINDSKYYTSEDIQSSYDKGYKDGINNETELNAQLEYYRTLVDEYYAQIVDYKNQNSELQKSNQSLTDSVKSLTEIKLKNEKTIADLETTVGNNNETISNLRTEISNKEDVIFSLEDEKLLLQNQVSDLEDDVSDKEKRITELELDLAKNKTEIEKLKLEIDDCKTQITILQNDIANKEKEIDGLENQVEKLSALVLQLQDVNRLNLETIKTLSSQIVTLNSQISELKSQIENNSSNVSALEDKISKLQDTIKYYENYIKNLESETQVVITFEFNEVVYNIQVVAKNSRVSVVNPTDTDYVKFNYWTVDGEQIDLDNYTFSENKKVVANCTYFQKVIFMNDSQVAKEEFVQRGKTTTAPSVSKEGFDFDGWTINGQDTVDVNDYQVDKDTTFTAKYTQLFTVTFMYESETKSTQSVRSGEYASNVDVDSTTYKIFNYWTVNGVRVDVSSYKISANTVFVADITYKFDVKFMVDDVQYKETQIITKNGYASVPSNPSKDKFEFDGWTINGQDVVNVATYPITQTTTFIAKFTRVYVVKFMFEQDVKDTQTVRIGNHASDVVVDSTLYKRFDGWTINGQDIVDVENYDLSDDITFIAKITYFFDVKFIVDGSQYDNVQIVEKGTYAAIQFAEPTKDGYVFLGWTIDGDNIVDVEQYVINDTTIFIAKFISRVFGENNWETISKTSSIISKENLTSEQVFEKYGWNIGDEKTFYFDGKSDSPYFPLCSRSNISPKITVIIIGFNHDEKSDGTGKAGITFMMKEVFTNPVPMITENNLQYNIFNSWKDSHLQSLLNNNNYFLRGLPSDLLSVIKQVKKSSSYGSSNSSVSTNDFCWLLSLQEIYSQANLMSSPTFNQFFNPFENSFQYEYFKNILKNDRADISHSSLNKLVISADPRLEPSEISSYYLRSFKLNSSSPMSLIISDGVPQFVTPSTTSGVSFCFCI